MLVYLPTLYHPPSLRGARRVRFPEFQRIPHVKRKK
jgi:hypothetical protein